MIVRSIRLWLLVLTPFLLLVSGAPRAAVFNVTKSADAPESLLPGSIMQIIDATGDGYGNSLVQPWGIAVDSSGNVYVHGSNSHNAFKITPGGNISQIIDATGDGAGNPLTNPRGITVDASGNVYLTGAISQNAFKIGGPAILVPSLGPVAIAFLLTLLGATAYWRLRDSASVSYH